MADDTAVINDVRQMAMLWPMMFSNGDAIDVMEAIKAT
jgi:hypothetical protein